jgi:hypothetical protein
VEQISSEKLRSPNPPTIFETQPILVFVRLAHDRRFVGTVLFFLFSSSSSSSLH